MENQLEWLEEKSQRACQEGIKYFKAHAMKHFTEEESYMASIQYDGLKRHRNIHKGFREHTLPALEQELEQTGYTPEAVDHFLGVCAGWLIGHTLTEDQAITGAHASKWADMLPEEEQAALEKVITRLVFDMFHLESQVVSDTYSGEKFGKGVYYRLIYGTPKEEKRQEVIMVFEERLLINTVGKAMGVQTNKLDSMLVHAARYTAKQFVGRVMEHLPASQGYDLKEENLLTYEQFQKVFQRENPQVSLLFNTGGAGYFAYCAIAPHLLGQGVATPIEDGNAMDEVEKYLSKREEQAEQEAAEKKPKILVVDDSLTVRQGMKQLLCGEYDVALAESGVAAIRSITLDKPDLVLLDYEMPVCDGKQTLEMLHSVPEFRALPVVFLTGRSDPDTVRGVMALNPAGYLLKYLKQEELKQKIDAFMGRG